MANTISKHFETFPNSANDDISWIYISIADFKNNHFKMLQFKKKIHIKVGYFKTFFPNPRDKFSDFKMSQLENKMSQLKYQEGEEIQTLSLFYSKHNFETFPNFTHDEIS